MSHTKDLRSAEVVKYVQYYPAVLQASVGVVRLVTSPSVAPADRGAVDGSVRVFYYTVLFLPLVLELFSADLDVCRVY